MITRNELFRYFCSENKGIQFRILASVFVKTKDYELAEIYGLKVLRKGYFTR